jgi:hypothetical protein
MERQHVEKHPLERRMRWEGGCIQMVAFWVVTSCSRLGGYRPFIGKYSGAWSVGLGIVWQAAKKAIIEGDRLYGVMYQRIQQLLCSL